MLEELDPIGWWLGEGNIRYRSEFIVVNDV